ncbi:ComF family protein [Guptibacillus hwajinpoensis]|uniref:Amidophosphoribosyltransferase n=1 Tax=Guptibacillus hwajinpoensis TaxID=208199 RepID=A0ABU0JVE0_9BACL|nr:hypothetical protein [Alkalihalobacillus hemicentroti]MDQ0481068.1 putative amidophosphoribosyltransferase [Alkalihalobacillus hemicentroti]
MYSLCTQVKNILVDTKSFTVPFFNNPEFISLLRELDQKYNLILLNRTSLRVTSFKSTICGLDSAYAFPQFLKVSGLDLNHTIIITGDSDRIKIAHEFNISTVLLITTLKGVVNKHLPDKIVTLELLRKLLIEEETIGHFNELAAESTGGVGYVLPIGDLNHQIYNDIQAQLICCGRYFTYDDNRSYVHCLSTMILRLKHLKAYAVEKLSHCLNININTTIKQFPDIDLITAVPGKPGCQNHLDSLLTHSKLSAHRNMIDVELLHTVRTYEKQKNAGSFYDRALNVLDAFDAKRSIDGHVLLIDDILTSGSTTMECARVLYKYGARKVTILPLSIMQSNTNAPKYNKVKDTHGEEYRLNFRNSNGNPFWVASKNEFAEYNNIKEKYLKQE